MHRYLTLLLLFLCSTAVAQQLKIKGAVKDSVGGLPGVSIKILGSSQAVSSDANGNFALEVSEMML